MKRSFILAAFALFCLPALSRAQSQVEFSGLYTWSLPLPSQDHGWGAGMNWFTKPYPLLAQKWPNLHFQVGFGGYMSGFGYQQIGSVPLPSPYVGYSTVRLGNMHTGVQTDVRFSRMKEGKKFIPYADVFVGYRGMYSRKGIIPYEPASYDGQANTTLSRIVGFHGGAGLGLQRSISETMALNGELLWSYSAASGKLVEVSSIQSERTGLFFETKDAPHSVMLLKAGIVVKIVSRQRMQSPDAAVPSPGK